MNGATLWINYSSHWSSVPLNNATDGKTRIWTLLLSDSIIQIKHYKLHILSSSMSEKDFEIQSYYLKTLDYYEMELI